MIGDGSDGLWKRILSISKELENSWVVDSIQWVGSWVETRSKELSWVDFKLFFHWKELSWVHKISRKKELSGVWVVIHIMFEELSSSMLSHKEIELSWVIEKIISIELSWIDVSKKYLMWVELNWVGRRFRM